MDADITRRGALSICSTCPIPPTCIAAMSFASKASPTGMTSCRSWRQPTPEADFSKCVNATP